MVGFLVLLALMGSCFASYNDYHPKAYAKTYCYQCEYVPSKEYTKLEYEVQEYEEKIPHTSVHCWYKFEFRGEASEIAGRPENNCNNNRPQCEHKTTYEVIKKTRKVPKVVTNVKPPGGFAPCKGPITPESAKRDGVDDWECHDNCYTRTDNYGRVSRGCYKHELGVNPNLLGCHDQGGYNYCFCKGNHCNGQAV